MSRSPHAYWRVRIMYSTMVGYILFYFVRKNLSMAMPGIESELGISKVALGLFITAHGILYGVSRFVNGILGDRANPRYFMSAGLLVCAVANLGFGMSSAVWSMGLFWIVNAWFQGMGYPPCVKSLTQWFAPKERGLTMSIWNTSHSLGGGLVFLLNSWAIWYFNDWRYCFFVPALLALAGAVFLWNRLRDSPESMGLAPIEETDGARAGGGSDAPADRPAETPQAAAAQPSTREWKAALRREVFANPVVWLLCSTFFFIYVVRFTILDWAPTFLKEAKGVELHRTGLVSSAYELTGVIGMVFGGYLMDRVFDGRGTRVCFLFMTACTGVLVLYWLANPVSELANAGFLAAIGFLIYGPQCLVGAIIANRVGRRVASAALGLAGVFSYASVLVTGWGVGHIASTFGWNAVFAALIGTSAIGTLLFLAVFNLAPGPEAAPEIPAENVATAAR